MHVDVVLSVFIPPCTNKRRRAQYSRGVDAAVCVCASDVCVCVCASDVCVRASDVCVRVRFRCVCARALQMCVCVLQMCVCASASDVCVRVRFRCVCACFRCVCARETSHTVLDCYSNNPERLLCSPRSFGQCLYRVLTREIEGECTRWW